MAEVSPTYSVNPADYEYDPDIYQLRHIPGVGVRQFGINESEESIQQATDKVSLNAELKYANLHKDTVLLDSFKRYSKRKTGEDFTGTDQEAVDEFMSDFAYIDNNLTFGLGKVLVDQTGLSDQDKFDVGLLYDRYNRTDATGEGSRSFTDQLADVTYAMVTDPMNAIGLFTGGAGFAARAAAGKFGGAAAKTALVEGFKKSVFASYGKEVAKRPITAGALSGVGWAATYDVEKQGVEIGSGMQEARHEVTGESESFDYDELLLTSVIGAGFGGAIGGAAKAASKFFSKGDYSNLLGKDRTNATTAELKAELKTRGFEDPSDNITFKDQEPALVASSKDNLEKVNKKFNETEEVIKLDLPAGTAGSKAPEQDYPINWINADGEEIKVTVSKIETSDAPGTEASGFKESPKVTEVTLRDQAGMEYKALTNENGGLDVPVSQFKSDEQMRRILDTADIKAIRGEGESPAGIMKKAHRFLVENFTSHFGLGPETAERLRDAERALTASGEKIDVLVKKFENEWEIQQKKIGAATTSFSDESRDTHKIFIKALTTADSSERDVTVKNLLPEGSELYKIVEEWRTLIQATSNDLIESGAFSKYKMDTSGNRMLDGEGNPIENLFLKTLQNHKKERNYLHSMYSIYEDPEYKNKALKERLGDADFEKVRNHFARYVGKDKDKALEIMKEIATPSADRKLGKLGSLGKKNLGKLSKENDEYVNILLGEITDPRQLFSASVFKTKKIVEDYKLKRDLVAIGLRRGTKKPLMARGDIEGDWKPMEQGSRSFELNDETLSRMWSREVKGLEDQEPAAFMDNPFDGIFVDPEYKQYYDVMANFYDTNVSNVQRVMATSTFAFNISKTVLSPTTHMRNFSGGMLQNAYNGILPWGSRAWRKSVSSEDNVRGNPAYSVFRRAVPLHSLFSKRKALSDDDTGSIVRLLELGVLHNGMRAGLFKEAYNIMIKDANPLHHLERRLLSGKGKGNIVKVVDKASEIYEMSDNINKISAFESEFGWLFRAFGDGKNTEEFIKHVDTLGVFDARQRLNSGKEGILSTLIEEAAAKKVNMFTPSYSQLSGVSRVFKQYPIGNFVAFPMEVTRNYSNSWRLASRELRSGSATMRSRGAIRASSLAGATGITVGGIGGLSAAINGITDDEREALESKDLTAPWLHGTGWFYKGKIKDGTLEAIPLSYTDPFSYLSTIAQVAMLSFQEKDSDVELASKLRKASWEAFKTAIDPYVLPSVGPATLMKAYNELAKANEEDEELDVEKIVNAFEVAFNPTIVRDIYKMGGLDWIPYLESPKETKWGTEIDPMTNTLIGMATGMKPQKIHIPSKVGFALSDQYRAKSANSSDFNSFVGNAQNWGKADYKENIKGEYKRYLAKEKEIADRVKVIFGHGQTLGLKSAELIDLATSFSKSVALSKAGPGKYRASFGGEYVASIYSGKYPLKFLSNDIQKKINDSLLYRGIDPRGGLLADLHNMWIEQNRTMGDTK